MTRRPQPAHVDRSIHLSNMTVNAVDGDRIAAITQLAAAAAANAEAIRELALALPKGNALGISISQLPDTATPGAKA
ncbi:hypothetical protein ACVWXN_003443 [Bradyrhizobium sp. i1.4.4]